MDTKSVFILFLCTCSDHRSSSAFETSPTRIPNLRSVSTQTVPLHMLWLWSVQVLVAVCTKYGCRYRSCTNPWRTVVYTALNVQQIIYLSPPLRESWSMAICFCFFLYMVFQLVLQCDFKEYTLHFKIIIYNGKWTEWRAIWSEIICVILKSE